MGSCSKAQGFPKLRESGLNLAARHLAECGLVKFLQPSLRERNAEVLQICFSAPAKFQGYEQGQVGPENPAFRTCPHFDEMGLPTGDFIHEKANGRIDVLSGQSKSQGRAKKFRLRSYRTQGRVGEIDDVDVLGRAASAKLNENEAAPGQEPVPANVLAEIAQQGFDSLRIHAEILS